MWFIFSSRNNTPTQTGDGDEDRHDDTMNDQLGATLDDEDDDEFDHEVPPSPVSGEGQETVPEDNDNEDPLYDEDEFVGFRPTVGGGPVNSGASHGGSSTGSGVGGVGDDDHSHGHAANVGSAARGKDTGKWFEE